MKNNMHLIRKRTRSSFMLFLLFMFAVQLSSLYENQKILIWPSGMIYDNSHSIDEQQSTTAPNIKTRRTTAYPSNSNNHTNQPAILMIHYHKTGFVLSRQLRSHAIKHFAHHIEHGMTSDVNYTLPADKSWGSVLQPRQFGESKCPSKTFGLRGGVIDVQESPDLYCDVDDLAKILLGDIQNVNESSSAKAETKIVHFVRDPYSMALSNYYYHAQDPTPEPWVKYHNPCQTNYYNDTVTLKDVLFPTLSDNSILSKESFDKIVDLCNSLYQTDSNLTNAKFDEHLHHLAPIDGLKLSTAQMMIRGGGRILVPGGDLLRMANNIIKLKQLQEYLAANDSYGQLSVDYLSMDEFIKNPLEFTSTYLDILVGDDTRLFVDKPRLGKALIKSIANRFAKNYNETKNKESHKHVTTGKHADRIELMESLKKDEVLGPVLDAIKELVNEALQ